MTARAAGARPGFPTRPNRIFQAEYFHDTLIVVPLEGAQNCFYQNLHIEASRIMDLISQRGFNHVVIDFARVEEINHLVLEALMSICRAVPGQSALCAANEGTYSVLHHSQLHRLFPHYQTRQQALQAVYLPA